jgi:hypothetical protein
VACSMRVFKMAAVVGGSNPVCVAAAAWSLECVAEMRNTGHHNKVTNLIHFHFHFHNHFIVS